MSYESISHTRWDCKYYVVFIPKCRRKELYGKIRKFLGPVLHEKARQKGCKIEEGHMVQDHVHMLIKIPPNFLVAEIIGYIKKREECDSGSKAVWGKEEEEKDEVTGKDDGKL